MDERIMLRLFTLACMLLATASEQRVRGMGGGK